VLDNGAVILGSNAIAEGPGAGFAALQVHKNGDDSDHDEYERGDDELGVREVREHCVLLCGYARDGKGWMGGTGTQPIMSGPARECWPELHGLERTEDGRFEGARELLRGEKGRASCGAQEVEGHPACWREGALEQFQG
jgi:hypothetical protein